MSVEGQSEGVQKEDLTSESDSESRKCSARILTILHDKKFHGAHLTLIAIDAIILLFILLIDLNVIPVSGNTEEEKSINKKKIEEPLHYTGLALLSLFMLEIVCRVVLEPREFISDKLEVFDGIVVTVSFFLDIALSFTSVSHAIKDGVLLIILLRLWRFLKLICFVDPMGNIEDNGCEEMNMTILNLSRVTFINHMQSSKWKPKRLVQKVSCLKVIEGDKEEIREAKDIMNWTKFKMTTDEEFLNLTSNCERFKEDFDYYDGHITDLELSLPIAYSILTYESVAQTERLLRAIYRSHNVYCIHIDQSSSATVKAGITSLVKCFHNVLLVSNPVDIIYNHFSRLQADINCMEDLVRQNKDWKYLLNIPSTQYPLRTNLEMAKILNIYNGSNDVEGIIHPGKVMKLRFSYKHVLHGEFVRRVGKRKQPPPQNITIVKGSAYGVFSRKFVEFVLTDKLVNDFLEWTKDIASPDEYFWATINHNHKINAPGGYTGNPEMKPWMASYAAWKGEGRCHGKIRHDVCVFGIGDLNELVSRKEFFANKFYLDFQPLTLDCMEEWLFNKTYSNSLPFDTFVYNQLPFIRR
ncbi:hypothetical protein FSP39_003388 [Pinctada imbricata]|uniref:Uncharacterized protein n=1 Tax=Pinctada imbricata TaxID=66713 RepID=A0AA88XS03_PINIB|nr:hypothetical protein FSP39_003388 [Pinctada imbricata]